MYTMLSLLSWLLGWTGMAILVGLLFGRICRIGHGPRRRV